MPPKFLAKNQTTVGPGQFFPIDTSKSRTFQVIITGVASVDIEGSNDGSNPVPLQTAITSSSGFADSDPWDGVRMYVRTISSGSVTVIMREA